VKLLTFLLFLLSEWSRVNCFWCKKFLFSLLFCGKFVWIFEGIFGGYFEVMLSNLEFLTTILWNLGQLHCVTSTNSKISIETPPTQPFSSRKFYPTSSHTKQQFFPKKIQAQKEKTRTRVHKNTKISRLKKKVSNTEKGKFWELQSRSR
jgi:hypothetical protein